MWHRTRLLTICFHVTFRGDGSVPSLPLSGLFYEGALSAIGAAKTTRWSHVNLARALPRSTEVAWPVLARLVSARTLCGNPRSGLRGHSVEVEVIRLEVEGYGVGKATKVVHIQRHPVQFIGCPDDK